MNNVKVRFIISDISIDDIGALRAGEMIISKMIVTDEDFQIFRYEAGASIEVETEVGERFWCSIHELEFVRHAQTVIIIFKLQMQAVPVL